MRGVSAFTALLLLSMTPMSLGQNLLTNSDFETGDISGWTPWGAGWGTNDPPAVDASVAGKIGNYALKLSASGQHSFGVYQEVAVTPGQTYRIDAYWKGDYFGPENWYEIILIDGPFSILEADTQPDVQDNFMYAYDNPDNPLTASFGWIWANAQNGTAVDWNSRNGERTATGSVMTVVLKGGACCSTNGVAAWFDDVSLVDTSQSGGGGSCTSFTNGDFSSGLSNWTTWTVGGSPTVAENAGELEVSGTGHNGGAYQQFSTGGAGTVVNVIGTWSSSSTSASSMWAELSIINGTRTPVNGVDEVDGVNDVVTLYRNTTASGWNGPMPKTAPQKFEISFVAADGQATLILKSGNDGSGATDVRFDDVRVHCVPAPATMSSLPTGFEGRTYVFPVQNMVCLGQNPVTKKIYAISNESNASNARLYRIDVDGVNLGATQVSILGPNTDINYAQGMTFDSSGNMYISTQYGKLFKGAPSGENFSFVRLFDLDDFFIGTFHGVGGIDIGPDNKIYINSGSESFYGYLPNGQLEQFDTFLNARILRADLDGSNLETYAEGIRNSFDIAFRSDGLLFGVENGPNTNCDYAEEFNLIQQGLHYGFPYHYGSDLSGGDNSIACQNSGGGNQLGPPPLPNGLVTEPAWANYGPDAKPGPGNLGEQDGQDDVYYGFDPHSSPNGLCFYEPVKMDPSAILFPPEFHGRAFVARFDRMEPSVPDTARDVVSMRLDDANEGFICNTLVEGLGRAMDVLCAYNGKVYILEYEQSTAGFNWPPSTTSRLREIAYTIPADEPQIGLNVSTIDVQADFGQTPAAESFSVTNVGASTLDYTITVSYNGESGWMDVSPASGTSTGESDSIDVTFPGVSGLLAGTYTATIEVADPAAVNSPQTIDVTVDVTTVSADFDGDGDVDMDDHAFLQSCYSATPGGAPPVGCEAASLDGDIDVDTTDRIAFQQCVSGQGILADPTCDD